MGVSQLWYLADGQVSRRRDGLPPPHRFCSYGTEGRGWIGFRTPSPPLLRKWVPDPSPPLSFPYKAADGPFSISLCPVCSLSRRSGTVWHRPGLFLGSNPPPRPRGGGGGSCDDGGSDGGGSGGFSKAVAVGPHTAQKNI